MFQFSLPRRCLLFAIATYFHEIPLSIECLVGVVATHLAGKKRKSGCSKFVLIALRMRHITYSYRSNALFLSLFIFLRRAGPRRRQLLIRVHFTARKVDRSCTQTWSIDFNFNCLFALSSYEMYGILLAAPVNWRFRARWTIFMGENRNDFKRIFRFSWVIHQIIRRISINFIAWLCLQPAINKELIHLNQECVQSEEFSVLGGTAEIVYVFDFYVGICMSHGGRAHVYGVPHSIQIHVNNYPICIIWNLNRVACANGSQSLSSSWSEAGVAAFVRYTIIW